MIPKIFFMNQDPIYYLNKILSLVS
jgi:hypothetical protein